MAQIIRREEAVFVLQELISSGILDKDIEDKLEDIVRCVSAELDGRHEWGGDPEELITIYTSVRQDLITSDFVKKCKEIDEKYRFVPCRKEVGELKEHLMEDIDEEYDECFEEFANDFLFLDRVISK